MAGEVVICYNIYMFFVKKKSDKKGFTLIELLVVITIFVLLTGVVLINQQKFNSTILLTNLAYDTALNIRQAQNYGINVKEFSNNGTSQFNPYGVHFKTDDLTTSNYDESKSFILYSDLSYNPVANTSNGVYPATADISVCQDDKGCVNRYNIKRGNSIVDICEEAVSKGVFTCSPNMSRTSLDVVFVRPNPDAHLRFNSLVTESTVGAATIILGSPDGSTRKVEVRSNGLIEVVN